MERKKAARARGDALAFLKFNNTGALATVSSEGNAHASTVYYISDDNFNIYFLTLVNTRKYGNISEHPQVAFTVSIPHVPQTIQIEGTAKDISLDEDAKKMKAELLKIMNSTPHFPAPISKLDHATPVLMWIRPKYIRWADYAFAPQGTDHVLKQIPVVG